jgi:hypothetical protein
VNRLQAWHLRCEARQAMPVPVATPLPAPTPMPLPPPLPVAAPKPTKPKMSLRARAESIGHSIDAMLAPRDR